MSLRLPVASDHPSWREIQQDLEPMDVLWYPSSALDFRPIAEFAPGRLERHGFRRAPRLMIYTDCDHTQDRFVLQGHHDSGEIIDRGFYPGTYSRHRAVCLEHVRVSVPLFDELPADDYIFATDLKPSRDRAASLIHVELCADGVMEPRRHERQPRRSRTWILFLPMTNFQFFLGWVGLLGVKFGSLVRVRQGLGFGGCRRSLSVAHAWLWWAGCRQVLSDDEVGTNIDLPPFLEIACRHGLPRLPPPFRAEPTGTAMTWSDYQVRPFRLHESDRQDIGLDEMRNIFAAHERPA